MKTTIKPVAMALFAAFIFLSGCTKEKFASWDSYPNPVVTAQMKSFVIQKKAQAEAAASADRQDLSPELNQFFSVAARGDWPAVDRSYRIFTESAPRHTILRQTAMEVWGTYQAMAEGSQKYSTLYANEIISSIPPDSIYFGGTDPGRFLITGMEKSQIKGDPFYLITQNALADNSYLEYVRSMYGSQLYVPTDKDAEKCFRDYMADAQKRMQEGLLNPGENIQVDPQSGRVSVSGQVAVMEINALLVKIIFDQNSNHEFYIEQSFALDWMYPYLEPHGIILKLNRQPLPGLSDTVVQQDHDYWSNLIQPMIGDWLTDDTSVQEVADFGRKVFLRHNFTGFTGDPQFIQNKYSYKMFSKERASIADLYVWRMKHVINESDRERMASAADFAFRQALALCPYNPEAVNGYAKFLRNMNRDADADLIDKTAAQFPKEN